MARPGTHPAFLFDLDETLIDSVYQHVTAWRADWLQQRSAADP
jgi:predicted HAD superfamily phosphohydrolase YqeG